MEDVTCTDPELRTLNERCRTYQGTAKISISQITVLPSVSQHISEKNVKRLCGIFEKEGCRRLDSDNYVSAVVSTQHLHDALQVAGVTAADLLTNQPSHFPHLHFPTGSIKCLHGQHRLKAGELFLPSIDQWWTVDLYLDDISSDLQASLVDEYCNERVPSDGEIYVKVRQYRNQANEHFESRWLSRLSDNKARRLRGLESHPTVRAAFDSLLALPSLLIHGMQIGSLPEALAIGCDEEIVYALTRLLQFWSSLVEHNRAKMLRIDTHTVESLQLLAPGVSSRDRRVVKGFVYSGQVFSNFTKSERSSIWKRLKRIDGIIPSLYTFFKDLWYLESCANCIKRLVRPSKSFPTIRSAMRAAFLTFDHANAQFSIQTSESGYRYYSPSQGDPAELGYRQLWLYAMRHYPKLSKKPQKKEVMAKPTREVEEPMVLYEMAVLAKKLGFQSPQIEQLIQQSPDRKIAQDALLRARQPDRYRYSQEEVESLINKVTECFLRAIPLDAQFPVQSIGGRETKKESRCGRPQTEAQMQDRPFLFIDQIHGDSIKEQRKATSIFVRSSVYFTFFSKLSMPRVNGDTRGASPNTDLPMSPLFVPSNASPQDEIVDRGAERERDGTDSIMGGNGQDLSDMEQSVADGLRHLESIREEPSLSENEESEDVHELRSEDEQPRRGSGGIMADGESLEDANMEENTREQDVEMTEIAQPSSTEEVQKALDKLEGRRRSRIVSGPSKTGRKGVALRKSAKFKPYDQTERRRQTSTLFMPAQESLEQDINILLQTAAQKQTPRPITKIDFLDAQHHPLPGVDGERRPSHVAIQDNLAKDHQQAVEEISSPVEFEPQPEIPGAHDEESERHGITNTPLERKQPRSESVPPNVSPDIQVIGDGTQQGTVTERPLLSPTRQSSTRDDVRPRGNIARSEKRTEERDRSPERGRASDATKRSKVTITFRARDEHGEWNRLVRRIAVDPSDPSPVERMAAKQARARKATYYDQNLRQIPPRQCFDAAIEDGTNTVFMTFGDDLTVSEATVDSITRALQIDRDDDRPAKRKQQT